MNAFAFLLSMTGLFFLFCFLPLWRHFAVCDQTTALPCCTTSHCHLECHSADGQRKQVLLTLHFLIENYLWEKGNYLVLLPEGASLLQGQTVRPKAKGVPLNNKAPLKVIPIYSCCCLQQISPRVFIWMQFTERVSQGWLLNWCNASLLDRPVVWLDSAQQRLKKRRPGLGARQYQAT